MSAGSKVGGLVIVCSHCAGPKSLPLIFLLQSFHSSPISVEAIIPLQTSVFCTEEYESSLLGFVILAKVRCKRGEGWRSSHMSLALRVAAQ
jgi:hypothetical protein